MKLYNSKTSDLEDFVTVSENEVNMYVCGPTLYSDIHIGNARPIIFFDTLRNYFKLNNYNVNFVSNITDIDDKIIKRAMQLNITERELVKINLKEYETILNKLNIKFDLMPTVTNYIDEIKSFIDVLVKKDYAYEKNDNIYFRTTKIKEYGILSNNRLDNLLNGVRVDSIDDKENQADFVLWKKTKEGENYNGGRPGWHTECVTMIMNIFENKTIDIHGGGMDLKFPHHENENAQALACDYELSNFWIHNGMIKINDEKMSKSLNNSFYVKDFLNTYDSNILKLIMLQSNYRNPINITDEFLHNTRVIVNRLLDVYEKLDKEYNYDLNNKYIKELNGHFEDDFNTGNVISLLINWSKLCLDNELKEAFSYAFRILNLAKEKLEIDENLIVINEKRLKAKKEKEYKLADKLRREINSHGFEVLDTRDGVKWKKI